MIIEIHKGESIDGALNYNSSKTEREVADLIYKNMLELVEDGDMKTVKSIFRMRKERAGKISKPVFTVSINPAPEDLKGMTDEKYIEIAQYYMEKMGYGDQPYLVFKHHDIEREHIHIVSISIDINGRKISDRYEKYKTVKLRREIEMMWGLTRADGHGKRKTKEERLKAEEEATMYKEKAMTAGEAELRAGMRRAIRMAQKYNYRTLKEYNAVLRAYRIEAEEVEVSGRKGMIYYNTDEEGNRKTAGVKASDIARELSHPNFEKRILENSNPDEKRVKERKEAAERIKGKAERLLRKGVTEKEFFEAMESYGIKAEKARSKDGTVFGLTFLDTETGEVYKASEVSREMSAQKIYARLRKEGQGRRLTNEERREVFKTAWECVRKRVKEEGVGAEYAKTDADRLRGEIIEECMDKMEGASVEEIMALTEKAVEKIREAGETETAGKRKEQNEFLGKLAQYAKNKEQRARLFTLAGIVTDGETGYFKETPHIRLDTEKYNTEKSTEDEPLKKEERELLEDAVKGKLKERKYRGWAPWMKVLKELKEEDRLEIVKGMTRAEAEKTLDETMTAVKAVNELLDKGFIIAPKIKDGFLEGYEIRNARMKEGEGCKAPEWLSKKLEEIKYENKMYYVVKEKVWSQEGKVRWQYSTAVRITEAMREKDKERQREKMQRIWEAVKTFNPEVAEMIRTRYQGGATAAEIAERMEDMTRKSAFTRTRGKGQGV